MEESAQVSMLTAKQCLSICLFLLLVMTPVPKHAMVKALIISCLCRSVLDIILPIVQKVAPEQLSDDLMNHPGMISFCVAESIL